MKLSELVAEQLQIHDGYDPIINMLALDSRVVIANTLFFALPGIEHDGRNYITDAFAKGAAVVLYEPQPTLPQEKELLDKYKGKLYAVSDLQNKIGLIASQFYHNPSQIVRVFAVTGTNGKTSTCYFLSSLLRLLQVPCGMIGTVGMGTDQWFESSTHTTPDAISLQKILYRFVEEGCIAAVMEASSHALVQGRLSGTNIRTALFTNLTRDHLDYHGSMENYQQAKELLFNFSSLDCAIINIDDPFGKYLFERCSQRLNSYGYTLNIENTTFPVEKLIWATDVELSQDGIKAHVYTPWGEGQLNTSLLGRFNLSNLLGVITALCNEGFSLEQVLALLKQLPQVPGRMQRFGGKQLPHVIVDYSHTPDSLQQALITLRTHCTGQLWCVFGCGGNRDSGKRPQMGEISERYSDHVIVTDDNPRHEESSAIIQDILAGIKKPERVNIISNRQQAIHYAINNAAINDMILVAGKGHETYQQVGDKQLPFSDSEEVLHALANFQVSTILKG